MNSVLYKVRERLLAYGVDDVKYHEDSLVLTLGETFTLLAMPKNYFQLSENKILDLVFEHIKRML